MFTNLILEGTGCRLGKSVWFGVFQAGIAYSDLKAGCGGGAQHAKLPFADRIRAGIPRGWGYDCLYRHGADRSLSLMTPVPRCTLVYDGGARPCLEAAS